jgi:2-dehydropantoate 2-reductase
MRFFANVYGSFVYFPTSHFSPGVVQAWYSPVTGILDVGRYPDGADSTAERIADAFRCATFHSDVRTDIMRWKYRKLLMNLGNAVEALSGPVERGNAIVKAAVQEGKACLTAAGHPFASSDEEPAKREKPLTLREIEGRSRPGGSTWQSLARHSPSTEVDYLNGEIVLLGRRHSIATPVNAGLQRLMWQAARDRIEPGSISLDRLGDLLSADAV